MESQSKPELYIILRTDEEKEYAFDYAKKIADKGKEYRNTPHLKAYSHEGKPCPVCGKLFVRIVVGGRSSCYCPECQKK